MNLVNNFEIPACPKAIALTHQEDQMRSFLASVGAGVLLAFVVVSSYVIGFSSVGPQVAQLMGMVG